MTVFSGEQIGPLPCLLYYRGVTSYFLHIRAGDVNYRRVCGYITLFNDDDACYKQYVGVYCIVIHK